MNRYKKKVNIVHNHNYEMCSSKKKLAKFDNYVDRIYYLELEIKETQIQLDMLHSLTYT